jgi:Mrp family chromosome partitioning ATPase
MKWRDRSFHSIPTKAASDAPSPWRNVAVILAQWGYRVLAIDWDIEAPGVGHYFRRYIRDAAPGVVDFL